MAFQPSNSKARVQEAVREAGSPARLSLIFAGMGFPVILRAVSNTSDTEYPFSLPRLTTKLLLFLLRLILPEITIFDETSNEYRSLSPLEKFGALLNLLLICIWVIAQIYCLM